MSIKKEDLYKNQYDYNTLKKNVYAVSLTDILKTQKLTAEFCVKYILNKDFQFFDEDQYITISLVKQYQPHLFLDYNIFILLDDAINKKMRRERIDSFEDFESFSNRME